MEKMKQLIIEELEKQEKLNIAVSIGRYLQEVDKKYPTDKNTTNVITLEGTDLVVYQIWDEQWENSSWDELERIHLNNL